MSCLPTPRLPTPPSILPLVASTPKLSAKVNVNFCCQLAYLEVTLPPIPIVITSTALSAAMLTLEAARESAQAWLDNLAIDCPRDS